MPEPTREPAVVLVHGDDPSLVSRAVQKWVNVLVGERDRAEVLDELSGEDYEVAAVVDAVNTPPFLADRRVVLARGIDRFDTAELTPLVAALADPLPEIHLVLERDTGGRVPKALADAVKAAGGVVESTGAPAQARARKDWLDERISASGVRVAPAARTRIGEHLGSDVGRLDALLETLASVHGTEVTLGPADVEPYLGEAGGIPPWELTDPVDAGDIAGALTALGRMLGAGGMHPLQVMATLHRHVEQALRLDGAGVRDEKEAAALLGLRGSTFPAKKALARSRKLGTSVLRDQLGLLATADRQLRGESGLDDRAIMEVTVARLADPRRRR